MRFILMTVLALAISLPAAHASERRITAPEIHQLLDKLQKANKHIDLYTYHKELASLIDDQAVFENYVTYRAGNLNRTEPVYRQTRNGTYYPEAYRHNTLTGYYVLQGKNQFIDSNFAMHAYQTKIKVNDINMTASTDLAIVDALVDQQDAWTGQIVAKSRCNIYLSENHFEKLKIHRMDCNTNTIDSI